MCTMNAVRSPMASGLFQHLTQGTIDVVSAGIRPGISDPFVVAVMDEIGIDLSEHQPQGLDQFSGDVFDVIISLSPEAHHHAVEMTRTMSAEIYYWPTSDLDHVADKKSRLAKLDAYRNLREQLLERIKRHFHLAVTPPV